MRGPLSGMSCTQVPEPFSTVGDVLEAAGIPLEASFAVRTAEYDEDLARYHPEQYEGGPLVTTLDEHGQIRWLASAEAPWSGFRRAFRDGLIVGDDPSSLIVPLDSGAAGGMDLLPSLVDFFMEHVTDVVIGAVITSAVSKSDLRRLYRQRLISRWRKGNYDLYKLQRLLARRRYWLPGQVASYLALDSPEEASILLGELGFEQSDDGAWRRSHRAGTSNAVDL